MIATATPTLIPTARPDRLKLLDGEIDPCLLVNSEEVEIAVGVKVTRQEVYLDYRPSCKYISTSNDKAVVLFISAVTDESIKKANQPWLKEGDIPISAVEVYESERTAVSKMPEIYELKDLDNLGDQAFLYKTNLFLVINVVRNNIFYSFNGRPEFGVDYDTLMKLINVALERMP